MSVCIHQNCDQTTVEDRPKEAKGGLLLSQLYCEVHLEEATEGMSEEVTSENTFALADE